MEFLFNLHVQDPDSINVSTYYCINDVLKYVASEEADSSYTLLSVSGMEIDDIIMSASNIGELDCYVYTTHKPIKTQECKNKSVSGGSVRVVSIVTANPEMQSLKPKTRTERTVIEHHSSQQFKLF